MKDIVHVVFAFSDSSGEYSKYVATTMISILENTNKNICFHLLHDETLDNEKKIFFIDLINTYKQDIKFNLVELPANLKSISKIVGTLLRVYIFNICDVDKIIYLDGDILVNDDIYNLWKINIDDYYCAAVKDIDYTRKIIINTKYYKKIGIDYRKYFNAGVLYFNCKKIRDKYNVLFELKSFYKNNKYILFDDQDFFNYLLQDKTLFLNDRFNKIIENIDEIEQKDFEKKYILHFAGNFKPWNCKNEIVIFFYYKYYAKLFKENLIENICKSMSYIPKNNFNKMKLNLFLLQYRKDKNERILFYFLYIFKGVFSEKLFDKLVKIIRKIKVKLLYNLYYVLKSRV